MPDLVCIILFRLEPLPQNNSMHIDFCFEIPTFEQTRSKNAREGNDQGR
jgi:hypothetical protein